jgi:uncharacterized protein (TIGR04255 family)
MPIPHRERVIYRRNPLQEVVCQIRFPRLLEIETEVPAGFQSAILDDYPALSVNNLFQVTVDPTAQSGARWEASKVFDFASADEKWKAVLHAEYVALVTIDYLHWEDFRKRLRKLLDTLRDCYKPAFFTRIGLRYKDSISRPKLNLGGVPWHELIGPQLVGILGKGAFQENEVTAYRGSFAYPIGENAKAQTNFGLVEGKDGGEAEFLIDTDFFSESKTEATTDGAIGILEGFRPHPFDLFRWCVTDRLHAAMEPTPVASSG